MKKKYMIGVDCGTTNVKAVLFDTNGHELMTASRENCVIAKGNCMEQDMEALWQNVKACLIELGEWFHSIDGELVGLGVSGQGEGLWTIDKYGKPVRNAILWNDARAAELTEELKKRADYPFIRKILGTYFKNGSTLVLMNWFRRQEPELFERTAYFFSCKDYIRYRLTGKIFWELSDASASCVNIETRQYAYEVFEALGIPEIGKKLPPLMTACDCGGQILPEVSAETGMPEQLPVSGGMLDVLATSAGLGAVHPGDTCVILGTTGMTQSIMETYKPDEQLSGWGLTIDGVSYCRGIGCMAATPNLDWAVKTFFPEEKPSEVFARMEKELAERRPGDSGLIYHPHISLAGERAPFFCPEATAQFLGIRQDTSRMDLLYAVLEGVAMAIRDCLKQNETLQTVCLSGGGAKSSVWSQIISDVLGVTVLVTESSELTAKGAALTAAMMAGIIKNTEEVKERFLTIKKRYEPEPQKHLQYMELYKIYKSTQKAMEPFWEWRAKTWTF